MLFEPKTNLDQSQRILVEASTIGKQAKNLVTNIFIDFKLNPVLMCVMNNGDLFGVNPVTNEQTQWSNLEELALLLRDFREQTFSYGDTNLTVKGLCNVDYDLPTRSLWIKSNTLGTLQSKEPQMLYANYLNYMLTYRKLKQLDEKGQPAKPNAIGKIKNYYRKEFELFKIGYMPIAILSNSENVEFKTSILNAIESTPLMEGMLTENAYDVRGGALEDYKTYWVSKRACYKFLEIVRPNTYATYGYDSLTLKVVLQTLFEYAGLLTPEFYTNEYGQHLLDLPEINKDIKFAMSVSEYDLGLKRMEIVH